MLLLKGLGLSRDYPLPEHRECGDIDIYLYGQSDKGDRVLHEIGAHPLFRRPQAFGIRLGRGADRKPQDNTQRAPQQDGAGAERLLVRLLEKDGTHGLAPGIQTPPATFNAIFLIRHAAVHFQKEGIVLRHLCDWACFLTRHWDEIDHALFRTAMEDYRMDRFADLMTAAGRGIPRGGGSGPGMRSGDARTVHGGGTHPVADAGQAPAALVAQTVRPVPEPLAAARSAPDTRMEVLLRYGARPVEREIHRIQVAAGRRRRNSRPNPPPGKAGRERTKTTTIQENLLPDILDLKIKSYICIVKQRKVYAI